MFELMGASQPDDGNVAAERKIKRPINRKPRGRGATEVISDYSILRCTNNDGDSGRR